jgi:hypothetical protein
MIEGGFMSDGEGGVGEPIDWAPGPGTSAERTLGAAELVAVAVAVVDVDDLAGVELVVGSATGVMGGACTAGITTGDGDAGVG